MQSTSCCSERETVCPLILADEPTGNLDTKTSYEIMKLFEDIHNNGNTLVVVTHEEDIASYTHRIVRMRDGLVESDKLNENIRKVTPEILASVSKNH